MKKIFLALMAVAAISFVGCKPKNAPEGGKEQGQEQGETKPTCTDVKLYYEVKLTGKISDYVKLNLRYIEIPDSNNIGVKENITSDWKFEEYTVAKGDTAYYGIEPSIRATELYKQALTDEAKFKTMAESNSTLLIAMYMKKILSDGSVDNWPIFRDTISLSSASFDPSQKDAMLRELENPESTAHFCTWRDADAYGDNVVSNWIPFFWDRH